MRFYFEVTATLTSGLSLCIWIKNSISISARKNGINHCSVIIAWAERDCIHLKITFLCRLYPVFGAEIFMSLAKRQHLIVLQKFDYKLAKI